MQREKERELAEREKGINLTITGLKSAKIWDSGIFLITPGRAHFHYPSATSSSSHYGLIRREANVKLSRESSEGGHVVKSPKIESRGKVKR